MLEAAVLLLCFSAHVNTALLPHASDPQGNSIDGSQVAQDSNVCSSDICAEESAIMRASMDDTVDPCEDFYEFACGKYIRDTVLPEDKPIQMSFVQVQDKVDEQLRIVLTKPVQANETNAMRLAKTFYTACMDTQSLNELGIKPMADMLETYGGWPVVKGDEWKSDDWSWMEVNKKIDHDGLPNDLIFTIQIIIDNKNSTKRTLAIDQPMFGLPTKFLLNGLNDTNVRAYYDFMVDAAVIFGANKSAAEVELRDALQFEIELANISLKTEDRRNISSLYNAFSISELQSAYPHMIWLDYINWNLEDVIGVDESEIVIVHDVSYMQRVDALIKSTPKRTIANYFIWRSVFFGSDLLSDIMHERTQQYLATTTGVLKSDPRQTECVKKTIRRLPISVGAIYVREYFNEKSRQAAGSLVNAIHDEFINTLKKVEWMDEQSRSEAIQKSKSMHYHIAYPDELVDDNKLEEYYHGLELESNSLFHNVLRIRKFDSIHLINKLRKPVNKTDWQTHAIPSAVNAYYSLLENSIQLPAAVLQDRFFSADRPSYMNFATIGWFIGHEITHGFDDEGRQFDSNGNLVNWWQDDTTKKFASKAQCIIDQYSNYKDVQSDLKVNGVNTQGENIADNGAVKGMYAAYQTFVQQNGPEAILPGMNYTANQLFWISAAQLWCAKTRPEFDVLQYTNDVHAPNKHRIIGTFSNMHNFSNDFSCSAGAKMNPAHKCEVW